MYNKRNRYICVLTALVILILGIYVENTKTDCDVDNNAAVAVNGYAFAREADIADVQTYLEQIVSIHETTCNIHNVVSFDKYGKDTKLYFDHLCRYIEFRNDKKTYLDSEYLKLTANMQGELIADYIHDSDGKKRI